MKKLFVVISIMFISLLSINSMNILEYRYNDDPIPVVYERTKSNLINVNTEIEGTPLFNVKFKFLDGSEIALDIYNKKTDKDLIYLSGKGNYDNINLIIIENNKIIIPITRSKSLVIPESKKTSKFIFRIKEYSDRY